MGLGLTGIRFSFLIRKGGCRGHLAGEAGRVRSLQPVWFCGIA